MRTFSWLVSHLGTVVSLWIMLVVERANFLSQRTILAETHLMNVTYAPTKSAAYCEQGVEESQKLCLGA